MSSTCRRRNTRILAREARSLTGVVAWDLGNRELTFGDVTENVFSGFWWGDAFPTLGVQPAAGRGFTAAELERGDRVAVLSHRLWTTRFGGAGDLVGSTVLVNGDPYTVVGIMPRRTLVYGTELWIPMAITPDAIPRGRRQFQVLARLAPGVTIDEANAELRVLAGRIAETHAAEHPEYTGWRLVASTWNDINVAQFKPAALILTGAVAFVLLLVCANVANLLLSRGAARRRELAIRLAMGAGAGRIARQLLTESVMFAVSGGALGVLLGYLGIRGVRSVLGTVVGVVPGDIALNARVLAVSALVTLGAGVLFGLAAALRALRLDARKTLQDEGRGATGSARLRLHRVFVGAEVALALVLLAGGGLLVHSLVRLHAVDPGFRAENVLTMRLTLARERYAPERVEPFFRELERRVRELPGVVRAATVTQLPPEVFLRSTFSVEGRELRRADDLPDAYTTLASASYFEALGVRVVRGRGFTDADGPDAPPVVVINEAAARRFFPGEDPIGRRLKLGGPDAESPWYEVVGIVASTRNRGLDAEPAPELFGSSRQADGFANQFFLLIRTSGAPRSILAAVRETVQSLDPQQPVYAIQTIDDAFANAAAPRRVATIVLTLFALFALLLAAVGIYSVVAYSVAQRTREIGVRMALGADRGRVRRFIVRQALLPVLAGGAIGLALAIVAGRVLATLMFGISATDAPTLAAVTVLLLGIAALASYVPARKASNLHPLAALHVDRQGH
ncbi:MAG: ABC transporter permease [Longimicrobiales bacterium]